MKETYTFIGDDGKTYEADVTAKDAELWARMYHAVNAREKSLLAERDRLRDALEKMLDETKAGVSTYEIGVLQDIARTALQETAMDKLTQEAQEDGFYE